MQTDLKKLVDQLTARNLELVMENESLHKQLKQSKSKAKLSMPKEKPNAVHK